MVTFVLTQINQLSAQITAQLNNLSAKIDADDQRERDKQEKELELMRMARRATLPAIIATVTALCSVVGTLALLHVHL